MTNLFNKNDPLIASVKKVMEQNEKERQAVKSTNDAFGVHDRKALPREMQSEWDSAYTKVLSEGVEALDETSIKKIRDYQKKSYRSLGIAGVKSRDLEDRIERTDKETKEMEDADKVSEKRMRGLARASRAAGKKMNEGLKMGDYGHEKEKTKNKKMKLILKRRQGKSDGTESVSQSRREDK